MISENLQELLSAYVDGELAAHEYDRVMSALQESASAREYVRQLREMSSEFKKLTALVSPVNYTKQFLQKNKILQGQRMAKQWGAYVALAAAVLIGVSAWFYWKPAPPGPVVPGPVDLVKKNPIEPDTNLNTNVVSSAVTSTKRDTTWMAAALVETGQWAARQLEALGGGATTTVTWLTEADALREDRFLSSSTELLTGPVKQAGNPFKSLDLQLPLLLTPQEFSLKAVQERWAKKGLFVVDLASTDTVKTLDQLAAVCKKQELKLVVDEEVKQRLAKKLPATFIVYLENANEAKLAALLDGLQKADRWLERVSETKCQSLLMYPLEQEGRKQLAKGLGINAERLISSSSKSISQQSSSNQGVVLAYYPNRLASTISPEVSQTLQAQAGPQSDALSVVFLLRMSK